MAEIVENQLRGKMEVLHMEFHATKDIAAIIIPLSIKSIGCVLSLSKVIITSFLFPIFTTFLNPNIANTFNTFV